MWILNFSKTVNVTKKCINTRYFILLMKKLRYIYLYCKSQDTRVADKSNCFVTEVPHLKCYSLSSLLYTITKSVKLKFFTYGLYNLVNLNKAQGNTRWTRVDTCLISLLSRLTVKVYRERKTITWITSHIGYPKRTKFIGKSPPSYISTNSLWSSNSSPENNFHIPP